MRWARTFFALALFALPLLALGFAARLSLGLGHAALSALLIGTLPLISLAQLPLLYRVQLRPMEIYRSSALTMLVLSGLALGAVQGSGDWSSLGIVPVQGVRDVVWGAALFAGCLAITALSLLVDRWLDLDEPDLTRQLMPTTASERVAFVGVTLVAAAGEELVYRGYLIATLSSAFADPLLALRVSSIAFGLLHAYQGSVGVVRTALVGAWFGLGWIATGSLWPSVAAHLLMNLTAAFVLAPRLRRLQR